MVLILWGKLTFFYNTVLSHSYFPEVQHGRCHLFGTGYLYITFEGILLIRASTVSEKKNYYIAMYSLMQR